MINLVHISPTKKYIAHNKFMKNLKVLWLWKRESNRDILNIPHLIDWSKCLYYNWSKWRCFSHI